MAGAQDAGCPHSSAKCPCQIQKHESDSAGLLDTLMVWDGRFCEEPLFTRAIETVHPLCDEKDVPPLQEHQPVAGKQ